MGCNMEIEGGLFEKERPVGGKGDRGGKWDTIMNKVT